MDRPLFEILKTLRTSKGKFILSLLFSVFATAVGLSHPRLVQYVIDEGMKKGNVDTILLGTVGMLVVALASTVLSMGSALLMIKVSQKFSFHLRGRLFEKVLSFSFEQLGRWRTGAIMVRLNSDVNTVRTFVQIGFFLILQMVMLIVGALVAMFLTAPQLAWILAVVMPLAMLGIFFTALKIQPLFQKARISVDELNNTIQENLAGTQLVHALNRKEYEISKFQTRNRNNWEISLAIGSKLSIYFPFFFFVGNLTVLAILWTGGLAIASPSGSDSLSLGQLVAFNNYAMMAVSPVMMLGMIMNMLSTSIASSRRMQEILQTPSTVASPSESLPLEKLRDSIRLIDVGYSYGGAEKALDAVNLTIHCGEKVGIIGATGSGKSTLTALLARFFDPTSGDILIDGKSIREYELQSIRKKIMVVHQESILFSGTIRDNLTYGRSTASIEELERAAETTDSLSFIMQKQKLWDESLGERGGQVSGGQRQRLVIARALLTDPEVLILDDALSSLDTLTEERVVTNLRQNFPHKTLLLVSQKISTLRHVDRILLIDRGRIVGDGHHRELFEKNELYRSLCLSQDVSP